MFYFIIGLGLFCVTFKYGHFMEIEPQLNESTLTLLHVFMRHGDRTPFNLYPADPYNEEDFYPVGMGQLTPAGKNRAFNIGIHLRKMYGNFLGELYTPNTLQAYASPFHRCTGTLALALAALFPPVGMQQFRPDLYWQPIPYEYNTKDDKLFLVYKSCPKFKTYQEERERSEEYRQAMEPYEEVIAYTRNNSGDYREKHIFGYSMYTTLLCEVEWGLTLPDWTKHIFPSSIYEVAKAELDQMYRGANKVLGAGFIMSKILNDTLNIIDDDITDNEMKLYIYCGHDMNIAAILQWLEVFEPHLPNYGAYIVIEIHQLDGKAYLKVLYQNYQEIDPKPILIPNCGIYCPLSTFVNIYNDGLFPELLCD